MPIIAKWFRWIEAAFVCQPRHPILIQAGLHHDTAATTIGEETHLQPATPRLMMNDGD